MSATPHPSPVPLTRPLLEDSEIDAVVEVLRSGMLVQGPRVAEFERLSAAACGRAHAVAVSSGTAALSLALEALGIGPGDEVLVPALTWPSPAHAVILRGARLRLVDVDPEEWNATPAAFMAARRETTRAAIAIDQFGNPLRVGGDGVDGDLQAALDGLLVVEDAACAIGSAYANGEPGGSFGHASCLSFHPRKILTTGEGGIVLTDDPEVDARLRALRNHGQGAPGQFVAPAANFRLTEIGGALGVAQMARLAAIVEGRRQRAAELVGALRSVAQGLTFQRAPDGARPNHQTLGALLPPGADREAFIAAARTHGAQVGLLSYALGDVGTLRPYIANPDDEFSVSRDIVARGVSLPLFPTMTDDEVERVVIAVERAYREVVQG